MGVDINDTGRDPAGETALHIAVKAPSSLDLARFLLENRANVDEEDDHYNTPLHSIMPRKRTRNTLTPRLWG